MDSEPKYIIYEYGATVLFPSNKIASVISTANSVIAKILRWSQDTGLKSNTHKNEAILFQPKNKCVNLEMDILIGSSRTELVRSAKTLSVFFHSYKKSRWNTVQFKTAATQCQPSLILCSLP